MNIKMEDNHAYVGVMDELIDTKQTLIQSISEIYKQIEDTKNKICLQKDELNQLRKDRAQLMVNSAELDIKLFRNQLELNSRLECQQELNKFIKGSEDMVQEESSLTTFDNQLMALRNSMQSAMAFYTDESLQMELMKSENVVREKRVELTKVEGDYNSLQRRIEEQQREKQKLKEAELEKQRQEEERLKILEREKVLAEEAKARESFREQKQVNEPDNLPFLDRISFTRKSNPDTPKLQASNQEKFSSIDKKIGSGKDILSKIPMRTTNLSQVTNFFDF